MKYTEKFDFSNEDNIQNVINGLTVHYKILEFIKKNYTKENISDYKDILRSISEGTQNIYNLGYNDSKVEAIMKLIFSISINEFDIKTLATKMLNFLNSYAFDINDTTIEFPTDLDSANAQILTLTNQNTQLESQMNVSTNEVERLQNLIDQYVQGLEVLNNTINLPDLVNDANKIPLVKQVDLLISTQLAMLVGTAPENLDTLGELANGFENNSDVLANLEVIASNKLDSSLFTKEVIQNLFGGTLYGLGGNCIDISNQDVNQDLMSGSYMGYGLSNAPYEDWFYLDVLRHNDRYCIQKLYSFHQDKFYIRRQVNGTWFEWRKIGLI